MEALEGLQLRGAPAIVGGPSADTSDSTFSKSRTDCASVTLQRGGTIFFADGQIIHLDSGAAFKPSCAQSGPYIAGAPGGTLTLDQTADANSTSYDSVDVLDLREPFYASTFPQCYALAATTVMAYILFIMLIITPRSFLDGGVVVLGRRGFTSGGTGVNIGGRPWLQKVAALTVAISLTIATANTFRVAESQYANGYQNATAMQEEVLGGTELKVIRIISNTFLWLAQAQTLIRLFPRQREKVIIKWTAFALITLDVIFQSLDSFVYTATGKTRPRDFNDAVPALSYLFELSLGVLYAAWVIYYSLMKKRYAFYHAQMKNICLVAVLSLVSVLVPVVFFILDVSKPDFSAWGDYVRWVGAAAASVLVWEWVERIEALEREEKKDGILGREVFDGDEMLENSPTDYAWPKRRRRPRDDSGEGGGATGVDHTQPPSSSGRAHGWPSMSSVAARYRSRPRNAEMPSAPSNTESSNHDRLRFLQPPLWPARPPRVATTPISRMDTASADSTVYSVRYQPLTESTANTPAPTPSPDPAPEPGSMSRSNSSASQSMSAQAARPPPEADVSRVPIPEESTGQRWRALSQAKLPRITRLTSRSSNSEGGAGGTSPTTSPSTEQGRDGSTPRWDIRARFEDFAANQAERLRERIKPTPDTQDLPLRVIPAPPRAGAALAQLRESEEERTYAAESMSPVGASGSGSLQGASSTPLRRTDTVGSMSSRPSRALGVTVTPAPPRLTSVEPMSPLSPVAMGKQPELPLWPARGGAGPSNAL